MSSMGTSARIATSLTVIGVLGVVSWPAQAAAPSFDVIVDNPITLNPATPNPVTIVNPTGAPPSTMSLNPNTPNPVTIATPPKVNRYQDFGTQEPCSVGNSCFVFFSAVTVETLILHASCSFDLPTGASVFNAAVAGSLTGGTFNALQPFAGASIAGTTNWGINAETYLFVDAGVQPVITVSPVGASATGLACTLSGNKNG